MDSIGDITQEEASPCCPFSSMKSPSLRSLITEPTSFRLTDVQRMGLSISTFVGRHLTAGFQNMAAWMAMAAGGRDHIIR